MNHYKIPNNYLDSGYIFNGQIAVRNAIDAIIMAILGIIIASFIPTEGPTTISVYILFAGLLGMIGLIGVKGIPLSTFILDFIGWQKRRKKPFLYNNHGESFTKSAADIALESESLRNMVAEMLNSMRSKFSSGDRVYVEGETFTFAPDPELEALRFADQEQQEKDVVTPVEKDKPLKSTASTEKTCYMLDADSILDQITLN